MYPAASVLLAVLVTLPGALAVVNVENEPPLADAGLDQTVTLGATVHLDGTGSRDPDGRLTAYEWSIESPSGGELTPRCTSCGTTRFTPTETGRYAVRLAVTDNGGGTRADVLYVDVRASAARERRGPAVTLRGPRTPWRGERVTYRAGLRAGTEPLESVAWEIGGETVTTGRVAADASRANQSHTFRSGAEQTVVVRVTDAAGASDTARLTVRPQTETPSEPEPTSADGPGESGQPPTVDILAPEYVDPGAAHEIVAAASDPDSHGVVTAYEWNTGSTEPAFRHAFPDAPGSDVRFRVSVTDNQGLSATDTETVHVRPAVAIVGPDAECVEAGRVATFDADVAAGDGVVLAYEWENATGIGVWGDSAVHRFDEAPGTVVEIALTVRDEDGATATTQTTTTVCPEPETNTAPTLKTAGAAGVLLSGGEYRLQEADAFDEQVLVRGGTATQVKLWAQATDDESEVLTYTWTADDRLIGKMKLRDGELASFYHKFTFGSIGSDPSSYPEHRRGQPHDDAIRWEKQRDVTLTVTDEDGDSTSLQRTIQFRQAGPGSRPVPVFFRLTTGVGTVQVGERADVAVNWKPNSRLGAVDGFQGTYRLAWGDGATTDFGVTEGRPGEFATKRFGHEYAAVGVYPVQITGPLGSAIQSTRERLLLTVQKGRKYTEYHWQKVVQFGDTQVSATSPGPNYTNTGLHHREIEHENLTMELPAYQTTIPDGWHRTDAFQKQVITGYTDRTAASSPGPGWILVDRNVGTTHRVDRWETQVFDDWSDVPRGWDFVSTVDATEQVRQTKRSTRKPAGAGWLRGARVGITKTGWRYRTFDDWFGRSGRGWLFDRRIPRGDYHVHGHDHDRLRIPGYHRTKTVTRTVSKRVCIAGYCDTFRRTVTRTKRVWVPPRWVGHDHDTWTEWHPDYRYKQPVYEPVYEWARMQTVPDTDYRFRRPVMKTVPLHEYTKPTYEDRTFYRYNKTREEVTEYYEWKRPLETEQKSALHKPTSNDIVGDVSEHQHWCGEDEGDLQLIACPSIK